MPWAAAPPPSHDYELSSLTDYSLWHTAWVQDQLPELIQADGEAEKGSDKAKRSRAPRPSFRALPVQSEPNSDGRFRNPY